MPITIDEAEETCDGGTEALAGLDWGRAGFANAAARPSAVAGEPVVGLLVDVGVSFGLAVAAADLAAVVVNSRKGAARLRGVGGTGVDMAVGDTKENDLSMWREWGLRRSGENVRRPRRSHEVDCVGLTKPNKRTGVSPTNLTLQYTRGGGV